MDPLSNEPQTVHVQVNIGGGVGGSGGGGGTQGGDGGAGEAPRVTYHVHSQYFTMTNHLLAAPGMNLEAPGLLGTFAENSDRFPDSPATNWTLPLPVLNENPSDIVATERFPQWSRANNDRGREQSRASSSQDGVIQKIEEQQINFDEMQLSLKDQYLRSLDKGKSRPSVLGENCPVYVQGGRQRSHRLSFTVVNGLMWELLKMLSDMELEKLTYDERGEPEPSLLEDLVPDILASNARRSQSPPQFHTRRTNESVSTDFSSGKYGSDIERERRDGDRLRNMPVLQSYADGEMRTGCCSSLWLSLRGILWIRPERRKNAETVLLI
ncbi:hypothetical protein C8R45DRAFT_546247 [Mycena sanguinolenta]|nr:hypothetical protein C8R45DRAFT_546247 [Mycena sanguinolenta]